MRDKSASMGRRRRGGKRKGARTRMKRGDEDEDEEKKRRRDRHFTAHDAICHALTPAHAHSRRPTRQQTHGSRLAVGDGRSCLFRSAKRHSRKRGSVALLPCVTPGWEWPHQKTTRFTWSCHPHASPPRKRFLVGCSSPFMRFAQHPTSLRA